MILSNAVQLHYLSTVTVTASFKHYLMSQQQTVDRSTLTNKLSTFQKLCSMQCMGGLFKFPKHLNSRRRITTKNYRSCCSSLIRKTRKPRKMKSNNVIPMIRVTNCTI